MFGELWWCIFWELLAEGVGRRAGLESTPRQCSLQRPNTEHTHRLTTDPGHAVDGHVALGANKNGRGAVHTWVRSARQDRQCGWSTMTGFKTDGALCIPGRMLFGWQCGLSTMTGFLWVYFARLAMWYEQHDRVQDGGSPCIAVCVCVLLGRQCGLTRHSRIRPPRADADGIMFP